MDYRYTDRGGNNFNLIRMISAYLVILSHAVAIQGNGIDIVVRLTGQTHSGQMAVFIFTFLSGIFITKSIIDSEVWDFFKKRVLRIYPELTLCLIVVLVIGSLFTSFSQLEYWTNYQTWKYFIKNLLEITNEHILPGVFESHPNQGMNGVLWYITFEIRIYLVWILLKTLNLFDDKIKADITLLILLFWVIARPERLPFIGSEGSLFGMVDYPQYTITFILGALVYINCKQIAVKRSHVLLIILMMILFRHSCIGTWVWGVGYVVLAMYIGLNDKVRNLPIKDLSYGIFLYGWPMGQLVYEMMPNAPALVAAIITGIIATVVAYISEIIVEMLRKIFMAKIMKKGE